MSMHFKLFMTHATDLLARSSLERDLNLMLFLNKENDSQHLHQHGEKQNVKKLQSKFRKIMHQLKKNACWQIFVIHDAHFENYMQQSYCEIIYPYTLNLTVFNSLTKLLNSVCWMSMFDIKKRANFMTAHFYFFMFLFKYPHFAFYMYFDLIILNPGSSTEEEGKEE